MPMMLTTASHYAIGLQRLLVLLLFCFANILHIIKASTTTTIVSTSPSSIARAFESSSTTKPTFVTSSPSIVQTSSEKIRSTASREQVIESIATSTTSEAELNGNMNHDKLDFLEQLRLKYSHQPTFLQSVEEIALSLLPLFEDPDKGEFYKRAFVAMTEPERTIAFRIPWVDDNGNMQFNRGWRVEFSR